MASRTYTTVHDIRLRSMFDRDLRTAGVPIEEREVLASRAVLGRYSSFFRNILSTIPVGGAVSPWVIMNFFPQAGTVGGGQAPCIHLTMGYGYELCKRYADSQ